MSGTVLSYLLKKRDDGPHLCVVFLQHRSLQCYCGLTFASAHRRSLLSGGCVTVHIRDRHGSIELPSLRNRVLVFLLCVCCMFYVREFVCLLHLSLGSMVCFCIANQIDSFGY